MKILPDYLIQYMPELEEALEELRLSVIDHAYELLKCLDIDELSSDDIRHKLELYSLKLENMTSDWLPNGRFYRMYSSIKHHRTRLNSIQSIVKSGGQFEGVWSNDFNEKQQFNYKLIQLMRHYRMQSPMDGYFYISGDSTRRSDGSISGSTLTALSTDALLTQALPAGYTYIYVPWPRPHYPDDSNYFYNVHMLQFDRFHYSEDCNKPYGDNGKVYSTELPASLSYYNNRTAKQPPYWIDYHYVGDNKYPNSNTHNWPIEEIGYYKDTYGNLIAKLVISKNNNGINSKMFKPISDGDGIAWELVSDNDEIALINKLAVEYYLDTSSEAISNSRSNWITNCYLHTKYRFSEPNRSQIFTPIEKSVLFTDITNKYAAREAIITVLGKKLGEADIIMESDTPAAPLDPALQYDSDYMQQIETALQQYKRYLAISLTEQQLRDINFIFDFLGSVAVLLNLDIDTLRTPFFDSAVYNRSLLPFFIAKDKVDLIDDFISLCGNIPRSPVTITSYDESKKSDIADVLHRLFNVTTSKALEWLDSPMPYTLRDISTDAGAARIMAELSEAGCVCSCSRYDSAEVIQSSNAYNYEFVENSIDENCLIEPDLTFSPKAGAYKFDRLTSGLLYHYKESLHHIKTYRPVWDVSSPIFAMMQSDYNSTSEETSDDNPYGWGQSSHSLYYWMQLKQCENRPSLFDDCSHWPLYDNVISENKPPISEETFTSYDRPTTSALDTIYLGLFYAASNVATDPKQGDLYLLNSEDASHNMLYGYNERLQIEYDPRLSYSVMNFKDASDIIDGGFSQYILGNPSSLYYDAADTQKKSLYVHNSIDNVRYSYVTYKTSLIHKLWFSKNKTDVVVRSGLSRDNSRLYNSAGGHEHYYYTGHEEDNLATLVYNIIGVYKADGTKIDADGFVISCIIDGVSRKYLLYYDTPVNLDAAYVLFTVDVINEPMNIITDETITTSVYFNNLATSRELIKLTASYDYIEPSITGGNYVTDNLGVVYNIGGGQYITSDLSVVYQIVGGNYVTNSLDIVYPITGGNYVTDDLDVVYKIIGGQYVTNELPIDDSIPGGNYSSDTFATEEYIDGALYSSLMFDTEGYIDGASYKSSSFNTEQYIVGANYSSSSFNTEQYITGASYSSSMFSIEEYLSGASYTSSSFNTEEYLNGALYNSGNFSTESYINGANYSSSNFSTEPYINGASYSSSNFNTESYIDGASYNSPNFNTESYIDGASYLSNNFNTESYIDGASYNLGSIGVEPYVNGGRYSDSESFGTEQYVNGSSYESDNFETE